MFELLVGRPPFESEDESRTYDKILHSDVVFPPYVSDPAKDLILKLLQKDSRKRIPLPDVATHPWILANCK